MADQAGRTAITVVMAVYDGERYLKEQLDSIAAQTRPVDEILVRDDGSHDRSLAVIEEWKQNHPDMKVTLLPSAGNLGYIGNFRALIEAAQSDLIFLCDQDDRWHPDKVSRMAACMEEHPDIELLASSFSFMNSESKCYGVPLREGWSNNNLMPWALDHPGALNEVSFERMLAHNYFQGAAMVMRRSLKERWLALPQADLAHDWHLALTASMNRALFYLDAPLFDYRIHAANVTGLPQARGRSRIRTLKTWMNGYYRTVVVEDMKRVLETVHQDSPAQFDNTLQARLAFCTLYLDAVRNRRFGAYLSLHHHPGRSACMSVKEYLVGAAYVFVSRWISLPEGKV